MERIVSAVLTELLNPASLRSGSREITDLRFAIWTLRITVSFSNNNTLLVAFESPGGCRVLDEGVLPAFWGVMPAGAVLKVTSGGWFDLEAEHNEKFRARNSGTQEYFIPGINYCVSVLSGETPSIRRVSDRNS